MRYYLLSICISSMAKAQNKSLLYVAVAARNKNSTLCCFYLRDKFVTSYGVKFLFLSSSLCWIELRLHRLKTISSRLYLFYFVCKVHKCHVKLCKTKWMNVLLLYFIHPSQRRAKCHFYYVVFFFFFVRPLQTVTVTMVYLNIYGFLF